MFRRLRARLTLLFLLAGLILTGLIDGAVYSLVRYSFQTTTDQALQRKIALSALASEPQPTATPTPAPTASHPAAGDEGEHEGNGTSAAGESESSGSGETDQERYDAELAPVFLVPLDSAGRPLGTAVAGSAPVPPDAAAVTSAEKTGYDLRTLIQPDGTRFRLLTARVMTATGPVYFQAGRSLADQERILGQLVMWILILSAVLVLILGWGSWWLAGRSLVPAQEAWEKQQAFVANASHELKTPLTLLRASAEVAQRRLPANSPSGPLLEDVLRETDHMSGVVEDLLLLSRLDADALPMELVAVDLAELFAGVAASAERVSQEHGIRLTFDAGGSRAVADPARLRQVLLILVDNALRHTPEGGAVGVVARQASGWVQMTVRDSGAGIAPEHLPHVFDRFYRGDAGRAGGSGLGLPIARGIVQAMHGDIRLDSRPGAGTTAVVRLPAAAGPS
jgi:signal transduction histidine kinase